MRFGGGKQKRELAAAIHQGRKLFMEGKDDEAVEFLEAAARRFPDSPEFPMLLVTTLPESRSDDARAQAAKAAELGSADPVIQVRAGHRLLDHEDVEAARACAVRGRELAGEEFIFEADLDGLIGRVAARDGEYAFAEEKLRSAVQREPEHSGHALRLARFLWARGRNEEALTVIDESLGRADHKDDLNNLRREIETES